MIVRLYLRFITWAFERFYHEGAWTYDVVAWLISGGGYWRRWIEAIVPEIHGQPVLELGCGTGYLQRARANTARSIGIDESMPMLRLAQRKVERAGARPNLVRAVGQQLPFADDRWPIVVATFPAAYLFDEHTLAEIKRVLAPEGQLLIVDGGIVPPGIYRRVIELIYRLVFGAASSDIGPLEQHDPRVSRLQQAGFSVQSQWLAVGNSQVQLLTAQVA